MTFSFLLDDFLLFQICYFQVEWVEHVTFTMLLNESSLENLSSEGQMDKVKCVDSSFLLAFKIFSGKFLSSRKIANVP